MPQAIVLELVGEKLPLYPGKYAHGLFFALVARLDPVLAGVLHVARRKPFTLTPLREGGGKLYLRFTALDEDLFRTFLRALLRAAPEGLLLGEAPFRLARVLATPEGHPLAGALSWEALREIPPRREVAFAFHTPTVFATSKPGGRTRYTPLPDPRLIVRSLLEKWQALSPYPYSSREAAALMGIFELDLEIASFHRLRFHRTQAAKGFFPGFTGEVRLRLYADSLEAQAALGRLWALAFYSGVGAKTPYGMGLTVPLG